MARTDDPPRRKKKIAQPEEKRISVSPEPMTSQEAARREKFLKQMQEWAAEDHDDTVG
jgi:hypothetical protein